jgi:hypothetical protein
MKEGDCRASGEVDDPDYSQGIQFSNFVVEIRPVITLTRVRGFGERHS